jgi:hypothetical protein
MRKADKIKLLYIASVSLLAFIVGCVDTSVQPLPSSVDYRSEVSIVNLTPGGGTATVQMYTVNQPTTAIINKALAFGSADSYVDVPAGSKTLKVAYQGFTSTSTFQLSTTSNYKMRIFLVGDGTAAGVGYKNAYERYIFQSPSSSDGAGLFPAGTAGIRLFNGSPDAGAVDNVVVKGGTVDTTVAVSAAFEGGTEYMQFAAGTYSITFWAGNDSLTTISQTLGAKHRYTVALYNTRASLQSKVLTDD